MKLSICPIQERYANQKSDNSIQVVSVEILDSAIVLAFDNDRTYSFASDMFGAIEILQHQKAVILYVKDLSLIVKLCEELLKLSLLPKEESCI